MTKKPSSSVPGKVSLTSATPVLQPIPTSKPNKLKKNKALAKFSVGDHVLVQRDDKQLQHGIVRFCGYTKFCEGVIWVGVELDSPKGKNDGTVLVCARGDSTCDMHYCFVQLLLH